MKFIIGLAVFWGVFCYLLLVSTNKTKTQEQIREELEEEAAYLAKHAKENAEKSSKRK